MAGWSLLKKKEMNRFRKRGMPEMQKGGFRRIQQFDGLQPQFLRRAVELFQQVSR